MTDYTGTGRKDDYLREEYEEYLASYHDMKAPYSYERWKLGRNKPFSTKKLIALMGSKGSGKTTLARQLITHGWTTTSFAAPIKDMLYTLLRIQDVPKENIERMIWGDLKETPTPYLSNHSPRHAMQTLGTEWRELIDRNLWLDIWTRTYGNKDKIIIDDLRFIHEADRIRQLGGQIIMIQRPGFNSSLEHKSENEFTQIISDITIQNNREPEDMFRQLNYCLGTLE